MKRNHPFIIALAALLAFASAFCIGCNRTVSSLNNGTPTPRPTLTPAPIITLVPTEAPTSTPTPEPTQAPTETPVRTIPPGAEPFDLPEYDFQYDEKKFTVNTIFFPENKRGIQDYNEYIYNIEPFATRFILPKGWTYKNRPDKNEIYLGGWGAGDDGISLVYSTLWIYDETNTCVGAIGYYPFAFDEYSVGEEVTFDPFDYKAVYASIRGGHCGVQYRDQYDIVNNQWDNETALSFISYSAKYLEGYLGTATVDDFVDHPVILSHDFTEMVYVVLELDSPIVDDAMLQKIAESLQLITQ